MEYTRKKKIISIVVGAIVMVGVLLLLIFDLLPVVTIASLQERIESFGSFAPIAFFLLQFIQVVLSPIPGNVTTLAGGALFGFTQAFVISSLAIVLGSIVGFFLARKFGKPLVMRLAGKETVDKYLNTLTKTRKIIFILIMILPFFPDDIICFVAGLTKMKWWFFVVSIVITRPIGLLVAAYVGAKGLTYEPWVWITMLIIFVIGILLYRGVSKVVKKNERS